MQVIADDRERTLCDMVRIACEELKVGFEIKRVEVGDFAIFMGDKLVMCCERKTWKDLAASMRDGRKHNVNKLIELRRITGCKLFYLIEGKSYMDPKLCISAIPFKNLMAHLDHLAIRDDIHIIHVSNAMEMSYRIAYLAINYLSIKRGSSSVTGGQANQSDNKDDEQPDNKGNDQPDDQSDNKCDEQPDNQPDNQSDNKNDEQSDSKDPVGTPQPSIDSVSASDFVEVAKQIAKSTPSITMIQEQLLRCVPYVGSVLAVLLFEAKITIKTLLTCTDPDALTERIANIRYPTGAKVGEKVASKIVTSGRRLMYDSATAKKTQARMLSTFKGISEKAAKHILSSNNFSIFLEPYTDSLAEIYKTEKTKLGAAAIVIHEGLNLQL